MGTFGWPFRTTRPRGGSAPRERLEEEVDDKTGVRNVASGTQRTDIRELSVKGSAVTAEVGEGEGEGVATGSVEKHVSKQQDGETSESTPGDDRPVHEVVISMCNVTLKEEFRDKSDKSDKLSHTTSSDLSESLRSAGFVQALPAQPGRAIQETPVHAAMAVMIKRERMGDASSLKRQISLLSRSIGRDGVDSFGTRTQSWGSVCGSDSTAHSSPSASPNQNGFFLDR